jgi:predicted dehydrogenase
MQIFGQRAFAAIDFLSGEAKLIRPNSSVLARLVDLAACPSDQQALIQESMFQNLLCMESVHVERTNAILDEQREFVAAIGRGQPVRVPGEQGRDALAVAERILKSIRTHRWNSSESDAIGPHVVFPPTDVATRRAA